MKPERPGPALPCAALPSPALDPTGGVEAEPVIPLSYGSFRQGALGRVSTGKGCGEPDAGHPSSQALPLAERVRVPSVSSSSPAAVWLRRHWPCR